MAGSEEDGPIADWRTDSRFYRRQPGFGWLLALLIVPLLLALIGWSAAGRANRDDVLALPSVDPSATLTVPSTPAPALGTSRAPADDRAFGPMSIVRSGNGFTLTGELPDAGMKASLLDSIRQAMPGARIVDELTIDPAVKGPEFSALGALFGTALDVDGFSSTLVDDTLTLTGRAPSVEVKAAAAASAGVAWSNVRIVNDIQVDAAGATPSAPTSPSPAQTPPVPAPGRRCATLQADVTGLLRTPITFVTDGFTLASGSQRLIGRIADTLKACPGAKVAVVGYTDNTGGEEVNVPLSASRAKAVADALVSDGVPAGGVTSRGAGSAKPVAGNDTAAGRAQNRRVEISVG